MNYLIRYNPWLEKAEHWLRGKDVAVLRLSVFAIFAVFGTYKWFDFEVEALKPLISSTWLNILYELFGVHGGSYFLGVAETATFILLILGFLLPLAGIAAALMVLATGFVTLSLMIQTGMIDSFIFKDVMLIGAGLVLLRHDLVKYLDASKEPALRG